MDTRPEIKVTAKRFGGNVRLKRKARDMTMEDLAMRAGVSRQTVSAIENGSGVTLDVALRLAEALGSRLQELLTSKEGKP